jgi:putative membrane protein
MGAKPPQGGAYIRPRPQARSCSTMKILTCIIALGTAGMLSTAFAADKENSSKTTAADTAFVKKAADGGMTEVELGKIAEKNGQKDDVKSFGSQMVKDHGKANDDLKSVATKMSLMVPDKVSAPHQAKIDKMSKTSGAAFDSAYITEMVAAHEKDIAAFEKARSEVSDELKKFIDDTVPVMKEHLEMAKKMQAAK